jgi:hypothetical protein
MSSPTGYVALFTVDSRLNGKIEDRIFDHEERPILHWNEDGRPVVADEEGNLVTVEQYLKGLTPADGYDPEDPCTYRGYFEVQPEHRGA